MTFCGKTVFITGASRGIGRAIALAFGKKQANVACLGRTDKPHPNLPGTVYETASEVTRLGGRGHPLIGDVTKTADIQRAVHETVERFNSLDIVINNAGFIHFSNIQKIPIESYDIMYETNFRASIVCSQTCLPYLKKSANPHIICTCPPLDIDLKWFGNYLGYTVTKFGVSMYVLGLAESLKTYNIAVNGIWPKSIIYTSSVHNIMSEKICNSCRKPEIMADSIVLLSSKNSKEYTGNLFTDEEILEAEGVSDLSIYSYSNNKDVMNGLYIHKHSSVGSEENKYDSSQFNIISEFFKKVNDKIQEGIFDSILRININVKNNEYARNWFIITGEENNGRMI